MGSFGWGAIQIGLRYSQFDASGLNVTGSGSRIQSGRSFAGTDQATSFNATNGTLNIKEQTGNAFAAVDGDNGKMNSTVSSYGIGLNWLLNNNFKLMFDYTRTDLGGYTVPLDTFTVASSATKVPTVAQNTEVNKVGIKYEDVFLFRGQINF
jgi:phosphate-selective porin